MTPLFTMRRAIEDPGLLGSLVEGPSWASWRALLIGSMGEPLTKEETDLFTARTGRMTAPPVPVEEAAFIAGRRSGKTVAAAVLAVYHAALCDHSAALTRGERGVLLFLAQSQRTAKVAFRYADALFDEVPLLAQMVSSRTQDTISLNNGVDLEIRPASFRNLRGLTAIGVIADELAYWRDDSSSNPDVEILAAVRPALATTGGPIIMVSSPYAKKGVLYDTYRHHFGPHGDPQILVAQGASRDFNATLPQSVVDRAIERDPERFSAEYLGKFRDDIADFIGRDLVQACVSDGVRERAHDDRFVYRAFVDPSGGSVDSMTLAIAHREGDKAVLDCLREVKPPFSPADVVGEFASTLGAYGINSVVGDRYGGEWVSEAFREHGIRYAASDSSRSEIYQNLLPLITSGACLLLDNVRLVTQLVSLERRTGNSGRDIIDHPPNAHDDLANAAAGALTLVPSARKATKRDPFAQPRHLPMAVLANAEIKARLRGGGRKGRKHHAVACA